MCFFYSSCGVTYEFNKGKKFVDSLGVFKIVYFFWFCLMVQKFDHSHWLTVSKWDTEIERERTNSYRSHTQATCVIIEWPTLILNNTQKFHIFSRTFELAFANLFILSKQFNWIEHLKWNNTSAKCWAHRKMERENIFGHSSR